MMHSRRFVLLSLAIAACATAASLFATAVPAVAAGFYPTSGWTVVKGPTEPRDVVLAPMGDEVFVADTAGRRIVVYSASTGRFIRQFNGSDLPSSVLERPVALTINTSDGLLYVLDQTGSNQGGRVAVFTLSGESVRSWGEWGIGDGQMRGPQDIAIGPTGDLYVADTFNNRVEVFSTAGAFKRSVGATLTTPMSTPTGIVFKGSEVYIAEMNEFRVRVFDSTTWAFAREWGITGTSPTVSRYTRLAGLELDASGNNILVVDSARNVIELCSTTGSVIGTCGAGLNQPDGVAENSSGRYVADAMSNRVVRYSPSTATVPATFAPAPSDVTSPTEPKGVSFDAAGNYYVTESMTGVVRKYDASGSAVMTFPAPPASSLASPSGIAVARDQTEVFVCDTGHDRIVAYTLDGVFLRAFGVSGANPGEYSAPSAVSVGLDGTLVIADTGNSRVQDVYPNGDFNYFVTDTGITPTGIIAADTGSVFVSDSGRGRICEYRGLDDVPGSTSPNLVRTIGSSGSENGQFFAPSGLAMTPSGDLVIADKGNHRVQWFRYNATLARWEYFGKFGTRGSAPGGLWSPNAVGVVSDSEIVIADTGNSRLPRARYDGGAPSTVATGDANLWVNRPSVISLSRSDSESGVWRTYYRLDGGPVTQYDLPFTVTAEGTTTISFWSVDYTGNTETTQTAYALIDRIPPKGSVLFGEGGQTVFAQSPVAVSSFVSGASDMSIGTTGAPGDWVAYASTSTIIPAGEGPTTFVAVYRDQAMNTTTVAFPCVVDGSGPVTTLQRVPVSGVSTVPVQVSIGATDVYSTVSSRWYRVDGGPIHLYGLPFEVSGWGNHTVEAWSFDQVDNKGATETITFGLSQLPLGGLLTLHGGDDYVGLDVTNRAGDRFALSAATTIQGAQTLRFNTGFGLVEQPFANPFTATFPAVEGTHTLAVEFEDSIGTTWTLTDWVVYDITKPVTTVYGVAEGVAYPRAREVSFGIEDASPGVTEYWINGEGPCVYTEPFLMDEEGVFEIAYRTTDDAGNVEDTRYVTFEMAALPPSGTMRVADDVRYSGSSEVTIESSMTRALQMRFDIGSGYSSFEPYARTKNLTFPAEGDYLVTGSFINTAGVETTKVVPVQIDLTDPETQVIGAEDGHPYPGPVDVSFSVTDASPNRLTEYWIDGVGPQEYASEFTVDGEGLHQVAFRSTDEAGNVEDTKTVGFEIAAIAPSGTMQVQNARSCVNSTTVSIESTFTRAQRMRFDIGTGMSAFEPYSRIATVLFPGEGVYGITGSFVNTATVETTLSTQVLVDLSAPAVTTLSVNPRSFRLYSGLARYEVIVSATATDQGSPASGIYAWRWRIGTATRSTARTARFTSVRRGNAELVGSALDNAANRGSQVGHFWSGASRAMRVPSAAKRYRSFGVSGSILLAAPDAVHRVFCYKRSSSGAWILSRTIPVKVTVSGTTARLSRSVSLPRGTWKMVLVSTAANTRVMSTPSATISVR